MSKVYCCRCDDFNYVDKNGRCNQCQLLINLVSKEELKRGVKK